MENVQFKIGERARRNSNKPVMLSPARYCAIMGRALNVKGFIESHIADENARYNDYLKRGNAELVKNFTGELQRTEQEYLFEMYKQKDEANKKYEEYIQKTVQEAQIEPIKQRDAQLKKCLDVQFFSGGAGPNAVNRATLESETLRQRKYFEDLNEKIKYDMKYQEWCDLQNPVEVKIIPMPIENDKQKAEEQKKKNLENTQELVKFIENHRLHKQAERDQLIIDGIVERERLKCLAEEDERKNRETLARKRSQARNNYLEALAKKKELSRRKCIIRGFVNRIDCAYNVAQRTLAKSAAVCIASLRDKKAKEQEERVNEMHCQQQNAERKEAERLEAATAEYNKQKDKAEDDSDERRKRLIEEMKTFAAEAKAEAERKAKEKYDMDRFELAQRLKNVRANERFEQKLACQQRKRYNRERDTRNTQMEQMRQSQLQEARTSCDIAQSKHLEDDKFFFNYALKRIHQAKISGRDITPIFKAVREYLRDNNLEREWELYFQEPHTRDKKNDAKQPFYHRKAEKVYAEYEGQHVCRMKIIKEMDKIMDECVSIAVLEMIENAKKIARRTLKCKRLGQPTFRWRISRPPSLTCSKNTATPTAKTPNNSATDTEPVNDKQPDQTKVSVHNIEFKLDDDQSQCKCPNMKKTGDTQTSTQLLKPTQQFDNEFEYVTPKVGSKLVTCFTRTKHLPVEMLPKPKSQVKFGYNERKSAF